MANEYKAWYRGNDPQNAREGWDAYNRPFGERYERPSEYQDVRGDAYNRPFGERYDIAQDQDKQMVKAADEKQSEDNARQSQERAKNLRKTQSATRGIVQSVAGNAAAIVVGAVVLVGGYEAIVADMENNEPAPIVYEELQADWSWDQSGSALLAFLDEEENVVGEFPAVVDVTTLEATCTQEGLVTYTATVEVQEHTYTDVYYQVLQPLGHYFDAGTPVTLEDGKEGIEYICTRCHEHHIMAKSEEEK